MSQSADVNAGQGGGLIEGGNGTQDATSLDGQESNPGKGDLETDQLDMPRNTANGDRWRSTRTSGGNTS